MYFIEKVTHCKLEKRIKLIIIIIIIIIVPEYEVLLVGSVDAVFCIWDIVFQELV